MAIITVREAMMRDLGTLLVFEQGVITAERPFDGTLKSGSINYYDIQEMIEAPHIHLVVAELNGEIVGSGYLPIESAKPYLRHNKHGYLGFMYVKPEHRGQGINKMIIEALKQWGVSQNLTELRLDVYDDSSPAIKAYEKAGFKAHMLEMRMGLV